MDSWQLQTIMRKCFPQTAVHILPKDYYLSCNRKGLFIVNTSNSDEVGSHWVVVCTQNAPIFFDPLGQHPSMYAISDKLYDYNTCAPQRKGSSLCWAYCIYVCVKLSLGDSFSAICNYFQENIINDNNIISSLKLIST